MKIKHNRPTISYIKERIQFKQTEHEEFMRFYLKETDNEKRNTYYNIAMESLAVVNELKMLINY